MIILIDWLDKKLEKDQEDLDVDASKRTILAAWLIIALLVIGSVAIIVWGMTHSIDGIADCRERFGEDAAISRYGQGCVNYTRYEDRAIQFFRQEGVLFTTEAALKLSYQLDLERDQAESIIYEMRQRKLIERKIAGEPYYKWVGKSLEDEHKKDGETE